MRDDTTVASVSSPSSNARLTIDITSTGRDLPLVGTMVAVENPLGDGRELAIGTITEVSTRNQWHENPSFAGAFRDQGPIDGFSGDIGDTRTAEVSLQAAWNRDRDGSPWRAAGPNLRMSPATGQPVHLLDSTTITALTSGERDIHYCGYLGGTDNVPLPLNLPDYSGPLGAWHLGVMGATGSGKTQHILYLLASQLRHRNQGLIVVDPQGQWNSEEGMAFSLQGWAEELGRSVRIARISEGLRLNADTELFTTLLGTIGFTKAIMKFSQETIEYALEEIQRVLRSATFHGWENQPSDDLLRAMLATLADPERQHLARIYATPDKQDRLRLAISEVLTEVERFAEVSIRFRAVHSLFQSVNLAGETRRSLWDEITSVFDKPANQPAPLLILDMSSKAAPGMDDEEAMANQAIYQALERDELKAAILSNVFRTLKIAAEDRFRNGTNLNTMVVLDEAWRYAPNPADARVPEIAALSEDLAGYARDTRKFGIGWLYITQSTSSLNRAIWDQLTMRVFGYGLTGHDLDRMSDIVDSRDSIKLYRAFGNPRSTGVFPFLITGPASPLAANSTPVVLHTYTHFDDFRRDNHQWIARERALLGRDPIASGTPSRPQQSAQARKAPKRALGAKNTSSIVETNVAIRENLNRTGIANLETWSDPLDALDAEAPF